MRGLMRALERNKSTFYYALRDYETELTDEFGNQEVVYKPPVEMRAHISPASGTTAIEQFGYNIRYDKVIVTTDMECPIDEDTVLVIDDLEKATANPFMYDYVVKRVSKSLNNISYAVEKVKVS